MHLKECDRVVIFVVIFAGITVFRLVCTWSVIVDALQFPLHTHARWALNIAGGHHINVANHYVQV